MSKKTDLRPIPSKTDCSANSVYIEWQGQRRHFDNYIVKYRVKERGDVFSIQRTSESKILIPNLKSDTLYEIQLYVEDANGDEALSFKTELKTVASVAVKLMKNADKICDKPAIYRLRPVKTTKISEEIQVHEFFSEVKEVQERTLLLVGASGSGKSTLVDAIINFITDVSYADNFRFKITDENAPITKTQLTNDITCYKIRCQDGFNIKFNLTIIDVPGFDGRQLRSGQNANIYKKLISIFQSVKYIDAACLVIPSFCRLTVEQRCIFNNILSIFGKDIDYVVPFITFDDGGEIQALNSLKAAEVPFVEHMHFRFNNSQLLSGNEHVEIWNKRQNTMRSLFKEPIAFLNCSVEKTREVLISRIKLNECLIEAESTKEEIEKREQMIKDYDQKHTRQTNLRNTDAGQICINCNMCKQTCVFDCGLAVRILWYIVIILENIWSFVCCVCSCCGRCCSRICRCSCKRANCCCITFLHSSIGCTCSCSYVHHEKQYGSYPKDNRSSFCSIHENEDQSTFQIQNDDEMTHIKNEIPMLIDKYLTNYQIISRNSECLRTVALIGELPDALKSVKEYQEKLKKQIES